MKRTLALLLTGFSTLVVGCQSTPLIEFDTICSLRPIEVSPAMRTYLRGPLESPEALPDGYDRFVRDLAAHNAKMDRYCPDEGT